MRLGDLNHLAAVGIGLNIGFSILETFRGWLRQQLAANAATITADLNKALVALQEQARGAATLVQQQTDEIIKAFDSSANSCQQMFVTVALIAAGLLIAFMGIATANADYIVRGWWVLAVMAFTLLPLAAWWLVLHSAYRGCRRQLVAVVKQNESYIELYKRINATKITPTPPENGGGAGPVPDRS